MLAHELGAAANTIAALDETLASIVEEEPALGELSRKLGELRQLARLAYEEADLFTEARFNLMRPLLAAWKPGAH